MENMTAKVSCFARAYHCLNHASPVFADTAARALLGEDYDRIARSMADGVGFFLPDFRGSAEEGLGLIVDRQLSPSVLGRSAYCERMLTNERRLGCRQVALFAAGYDTLAIRNAGAGFAVYELDRPEVLRDKRARITRAGLESRAADVPCDLSDASWADRLLARGFDPAAKAFGSLLGISYYLEKADFSRFLKTFAGIVPEGSAVCLDYPTADDGPEARVNRALALGANEGMKARYAGRELEDLLAGAGFLTYERLDHRAMTAQYFAAHNRRCPDRPMEAPAGVGYVLAVRKG